MENLAILLIVITLFLLAIILGLLVVLVLKVLKQPQISSNSAPAEPQAPAPSAPPVVDDKTKKYHPAVLERMKEAERLRPTRSQLFCPNHPDEPGETNCAICDRLFCKSCIRPFKNIHFCLEHLHLVMRHEWEEVLTVKTSAQDPELGVRLFETKKTLLETEGVATYVETHYKINVDQDFIETYLVLFGIAEEVEDTKSKFKDFL